MSCWLAEDSKKSLQTRSDFEYQNFSYLDLDPPLSSELSSSFLISICNFSSGERTEGEGGCGWARILDTDHPAQSCSGRFLASRGVFRGGGIGSRASAAFVYHVIPLKLNNKYSIITRFYSLQKVSSFLAISPFYAVWTDRLDENENE